MFLWAQSTTFEHWFRWWLGAEQTTSHYLNQWWIVYWRIYASLGLNELSPHIQYLNKENRISNNFSGGALRWLSSWHCDDVTGRSLVVAGSGDLRSGAPHTAHLSTYPILSYLPSCSAFKIFNKNEKISTKRWCTSRYDGQIARWVQ